MSEFSSRSMITPEGGYAVKFINGTGAASVRGALVSISDPFTVDIAPLDEASVVGVWYEDGVADGEEGWVVVSGIAAVLFEDGATVGQIARNGVTADGSTAGYAVAMAIPASPFPEELYLKIGMVLETCTGEALANVCLS